MIQSVTWDDILGAITMLALTCAFIWWIKKAMGQ
jgi:hypothetical protein